MINEETNQNLDILNKNLINLSNEEKVNFLLKLDVLGESFLSQAILNYPEQVELIFNNDLLNDLDNESIAKLFTTLINQKKILLNLACQSNLKTLDILLKSKIFTKLDSNYKTKIFRAKATDTSLTLLLESIYQNKIDCLSMLVSSASLIDLDQDKIYALFNDKVMGKNIFHKAVKKSFDHFSTLLNSELYNKLAVEQKFTLLDNYDNEFNLLLLNIITNNSKQGFFRSLFASKSFKEFNENQQKRLLYLRQDDSKVLWYNLMKKPNNIKSFIENSPQFMVQAFFDFIKKYYWDTCCPEDSQKPALRKTFTFENLLQIANVNPLYKEVVDQNNYSILYYLASYGMPINELKRYRDQYGFKISAKKGDEVIIQDHNILFKSQGATQDILIINGKYTNNDIISGLEAAIHQMGINVLAINSNFYSNGKNIDIKHIIDQYPRRNLLDFIIINAHGNAKNDHSDTVLFIYEKDKLITSKTLFKNIISAIGTTKPIGVFLTSCSGQLATKVVQQVLPQDSKIITVGERTNITKHDTQVTDIQNIAKTIQMYAVKEDDIGSKKYTLEKMVIDYLMHLGEDKTTRGIPTYTKIGYKAISMLDLEKSNVCIGNLNAAQKESLCKTLCFNKDMDCIIKLEHILLKWSQEKYREKDSIKYLQAKNSTTELGIVLAIKFVDNVYCQNVYGYETLNYDRDFCCNNLYNSFIDSIVGWLGCFNGIGDEL